MFDKLYKTLMPQSVALRSPSSPPRSKLMSRFGRHDWEGHKSLAWVNVCWHGARPRAPFVVFYRFFLQSEMHPSATYGKGPKRDQSQCWVIYTRRSGDEDLTQLHEHFPRRRPPPPLCQLFKPTKTNLLSQNNEPKHG